MADRNTPLLILGLSLLGVGAFFLGRRLGARSVAPLPPALPPAEGVGTPPTPSRQAAWAALEFSVDLFPATGQADRVDPPGTDEAVVVSPACDLIAVGHGFWPLAVAEGVQGVAAGQTVEHAAQAVLGNHLPAGCEATETAALQALRGVLVDRLRFALVGSIPSLPQAPSGPGHWSPFG